MNKISTKEVELINRDSSKILEEKTKKNYLYINNQDNYEKQMTGNENDNDLDDAYLSKKPLNYEENETLERKQFATTVKANKSAIKTKLKNLDINKIDFTDFEKAIFLTKTALDNCRLEDAVKFAEDAVFYSNNEFNEEHRDLIICSFKSYLIERREAYKYLLVAHNKEKESHSKYSKLLAEVKLNVEKKILSACERQIDLINKHIQPKLQSFEGQADFLKLKGDIYRYLCEISTGEIFLVNKQKATQLYKECLKMCDELNPLSHIRLGAYLNFSVYCYEILHEPKVSLAYSTTALKKALQELNNLKIHENQSEHVKDTLEILHILKENNTEWYNEIESSSYKKYSSPERKKEQFIKK